MINFQQPAHLEFRAIYAERTQNVVLWIGSGLSAPSLPTWKELREKIHQRGVEDADGLDEQARTKRLSQLERAGRISDNWTAFSKLREFVGSTSFTSVVTSSLKLQTHSDLSIYRKLWKLNIKGILSLNLDTCASVAFSQQYPDRVLTAFSGRNAGKYSAALKSSSPFLVNLHGVIEDKSTWVLTRDELKELTNGEGYKTFINSILATQTILYVGISADDVACSVFLDKLRSNGVEIGPSYWLTERTDEKTERWAQENGISRIVYDNNRRDHREVGEFLDDLLNSVPDEEAAPPPVIPGPMSPAFEHGNLPSLNNLDFGEPEAIRISLNNYAAALLNSDNDNRATIYDEFLTKHAKHIHMSWYVGTSKPDNVLFGYNILSVVGTGTFGTVYKAVAPDGGVVAMKLLQPEVQRNYGMLASFRRGVQAMRIFSRNHTEGIVKYRGAFELPACLIMDFVEGANLETVVKQNGVTSWRQRLGIAKSIVDIVRSGHLLPERILHRDIRPANIMLRRSDQNQEEWTVVVLDFDLSWHRDALDESFVPNGASALAYIAPEQFRRMNNASSRSALVDSFGCGMTFYFVCTRNHPTQSEHSSQDWAGAIFRQMRNCPFNNWVSLPVRFARLIVASTRIDQSMRPDMATIQNEIDRLREIENNPQNVTSAELAADEILCRVFSPEQFDWNTDRLEGAVRFSNGLTLRLRGNETLRRVELKMAWYSTGVQIRTQKFLHADLKVSQNILRQSGWIIETTDKDYDSLVLNAYIEIHAAVRAIDATSAALRQAVNRFSPHG